MLRRNFIKTSLIATGGTLILAQIPLAGTSLNRNPEQHNMAGYKPKMNLFGHKRSGCATRPELAAAFEDGYCVVPF